MCPASAADVQHSIPLKFKLLSRNVDQCVFGIHLYVSVVDIIECVLYQVRLQASLAITCRRHVVSAPAAAAC